MGMIGLCKFHPCSSLRSSPLPDWLVGQLGWVDWAHSTKLLSTFQA